MQLYVVGSPSRSGLTMFVFYLCIIIIFIAISTNICGLVVLGTMAPRIQVPADHETNFQFFVIRSWLVKIELGKMKLYFEIISLLPVCNDTVMNDQDCNCWIFRCLQIFTFPNRHVNNCAKFASYHFSHVGRFIICHVGECIIFHVGSHFNVLEFLFES